MVNLEKAHEWGIILRSKKRIHLLAILHKPLGYLKIKKDFELSKIKVGASEIYKSLDNLLEHNLIEQNEVTKRYVMTQRGARLLEFLEERDLDG